jgi:uncharacterized Fe-S cluster protein YjdI
MSDKKVIIKNYSNDDITVVWKPDACTHSKKCWKELIQVFDPRNKPWVNMDGATTGKIKRQVASCPSGALSYKMKNEIVSKEAQDEMIKVECMQNGPLMVLGNVHITNSDGSIEERKKVTAFCRCGASTNKPFCDGKHNEANFVG